MTSVKNKPSRIFSQASSYFEELQEKICAALEVADGQGQFSTDAWSRKEGGGGRSRVLEEGGIFEKAGVNVSTIHGMMPESIAKKMEVPPSLFFASGISLVLHPQSPMIPTVHANFRCFEREDGDRWFGGGVDLTPYYLFEDDARHFHDQLKRACDVHDKGYYPKFKKWCDEYFFVKHRAEARGVGGVFFDYLRDDAIRIFDFVRSLGDSFLPAYLPIVERRKDEDWGEQERSWQLLRRGRYVEFNLVYDRGTTFGLETNGRVESILMSLPPVVEWHYNRIPDVGTRESDLLMVLRHPREWAANGSA